jgi:uncharacterized membrane protein YedE/YeeE
VIDVLHDRPSWFVLGPLIGLVVVGLLWTIDERIGVLGGFSGIVERSTGRAEGLSWRVWFLFGVVGGGGLFRLLGGAPDVATGSYGWVTREFSDPVAAGALVVAGGLIGYGAKQAGGCTSGNGLGGCSLGSTASFAATATFMGVAIVTSFVIKGVFL